MKYYNYDDEDEKKKNIFKNKYFLISILVITTVFSVYNIYNTLTSDSYNTGKVAMKTNQPMSKEALQEKLKQEIQVKEKEKSPLTKAELMKDVPPYQSPFNNPTDLATPPNNQEVINQSTPPIVNNPVVDNPNNISIVPNYNTIPNYNNDPSQLNQKDALNNQAKAPEPEEYMALKGIAYKNNQAIAYIRNGHTTRGYSIGDKVENKFTIIDITNNSIVVVDNENKETVFYK